jgi:hypothetical protein
MMEQQIGSITKNLDEKAIEGLIKKSHRLIKMFKQIQEKDVALQVRFSVEKMGFLG